MIPVELPIPVELYKVLRSKWSGEKPLYLVGGTVRDLLLKKESHDFDFVYEDDVRPLAKAVADALEGTYYLLDDERNTARVIYSAAGQKRVILDFATFRDTNLESDLRGRDFTINAMGIDLLSNPTEVIDPLGGALDLKNKVLRTCSPSAFRQDPVRLLRGVRLAAMLRLRILAETKAEMQKTVSLLSSQPAERQRDELFRLLEGPWAPAAIRLVESFDMLPHVLPELLPMKGLAQPKPHVTDCWEHTLAALQELNNLYTVLVGEYLEEASNLTLGSAVIHLGRYRSQMADHFEQFLNINRSRRSLLAFGVLFHDVGKPACFQKSEHGTIHFYSHEKVGAEMTADRARALALSQDEVNYLFQLISNHMRFHNLATVGTPSHRAVYRFFRDTGPVGIDICLAGLADTLATWRSTLDHQLWLRELEVCRVLLEAWWEKKDIVVQPVRLINGHELQKHFKIEAGPLIGEMLEAVREAQAMGEIGNQEEAITYLDGWLTSKKEENHE